MSSLPAPSVNSVAFSGFNSSSNPYHSGRPSFPEESVEKILTSIVKPVKEVTHVNIVELACGTGKFTTVLLKRILHHISEGSSASSSLPFHLCLFHLHCSDPVDQMLNEFKKFVVPPIDSLSPSSLAVNHVDLSVQKGTADSMPFVESNSADGVIAAQAFHWFDNYPSIVEIHRVLKVGSPFVMIWNEMDDKAEGVKELQKITIRYVKKEYVPQFKDKVHGGHPWQKIWEDDRIKNKLFTFPLEHFEQKNSIVQTGGIQLLFDRIFSVSYMQNLPEEEKQKIRDEVVEITKNHPEFRGKEEFTIPYNTHVFMVRKI